MRIRLKRAHKNAALRRPFRSKGKRPYATSFSSGAACRVLVNRAVVPLAALLRRSVFALEGRSRERQWKVERNCDRPLSSALLGQPFGVVGADLRLALVNNGPVTPCIDSQATE